MRCVEIRDYTIPMFGNKRAFPYGKMLVEHEGEQRVVAFGDQEAGQTYIVFNRKRYCFQNVGSLYHPKSVFEGEEETK